MPSLQHNLTEERVRLSIDRAGIDADLLRDLKRLDHILRQASAETWQPFDAFLRNELDNLIANNERRESLETTLKSMFRSLAGATVEFEEVCNRLQIWLDLHFFGMPPEWPAMAYENYLRVVSAELDRSSEPRGDAVATAIQKFVMLHLGLATAALLHSEQAHYRQQLFYDSATKLPGSELFIETLEQHIASNAPTKKELMAVLMFETTASHRLLGYPGYPTVDEYMTEVTARIKPALRARDFLARIGRQEFGILLPDLRSEGQAMLAANKMLGTLNAPIVLDKTEILPQCALGIALFPDHGDDSQTILRMAETACTAARSSPDPYIIYHADLDQGERIQRTIESELRTALRENELMIYYQPQLSFSSGVIEGAEALLRWRNLRGDFVPPNVVVEVAERCGLMTELTQWILNTALRHSAEMRADGIDITLSVNLAAQDLVSPEFVEITDQTLRTWGVPPEKLVLEITEGSMISEVERVHEVLTRLKQVGVEISIDDFGTGYSSLAYLKRLPLDELKIDQVFVRQMLKDSQDERIVRTIIDLAHNLGLRVVAEGVEDDATLLVLKQLHCDVAQGYCLSKPKPLAEFSEWWRARAKAGNMVG